MNKAKTYINLPEMRLYYLVFISISLAFIFIRDAKLKGLIIGMFYTNMIEVRVIGLLYKSRKVKCLKIETVKAYLLYLIVLYLILIYFMGIVYGFYFILGLLVMLFFPRYFFFSKKKFVSRLMVKPYVFCKKYYIDIIFVYLLNILLINIGDVDTECNIFIKSIEGSLVLVLFALLWHVVFKLVKNNSRMCFVCKGKIIIKTLCFILFFLLFSNNLTQEFLIQDFVFDSFSESLGVVKFFLCPSCR